MLRIETIEGKTIKEWAAADLPHGAFERMVREVDPFYGIYAEAGAAKKRYRVRGSYSLHDNSTPEVVVEAFDTQHACAIAFDERGWRPSDMRATLIEEDA